MPIVIQRRLQLAGHTPIAVVGGATGMIGDPSGRSSERNLLDRDTLAANVAGIRAQLSGRLLDFRRRQRRGQAGQQRRLVRRRVVPRVPARRRQARHDQLHAGQGLGEVAARAARRRPVVHRVQLHAAAGVGLRRAGARPRLPAADRRQRSVGQHHRRLRAVAPPERAAAVGPDRAAVARRQRPEDGKTSTGERVWLDPEQTTSYAFFQYFVNVDDAIAPAMLKKFSFRPLSELDGSSPSTTAITPSATASASSPGTSRGGSTATPAWPRPSAPPR
ncbi:MAG: hypothetical protein IPH44_21325 [Myxococcales bacterium]|nr:hypothetical protein [Myxococcales bacterium]